MPLEAGSVARREVQVCVFSSLLRVFVIFVIFVAKDASD